MNVGLNIIKLQINLMASGRTTRRGQPIIHRKPRAPLLLIEAPHRRQKLILTRGVIPHGDVIEEAAELHAGDFVVLKGRDGTYLGLHTDTGVMLTHKLRSNKRRAERGDYSLPAILVGGHVEDFSTFTRLDEVRGIPTTSLKSKNLKRVRIVGRTTER